MDKIIEELKQKAGELIPAVKAYRPRKSDSKFLLNLLWLVPVLVLVLVIKLNWMPFGGSVAYTIDAGADDTHGAAVLTEPWDRISNASEIDGVSVRELEGGAVYFTLDSSALGKASRVEVAVRFSGDFPASSSFMAGAKEKGKSSYLWEYIYSPFYEQLSELPLVTMDDYVTIYATDTENPPGFVRVEEFTAGAPLGSVAASNNVDFSVDQRVAVGEFPGIEVLDFADGGPFYNMFVDFKPVPRQLESDNILLGPHEFYFHTDGGDVDITVGKRDRNYLKGLDNIDITVYTLDGEAVASHVIWDDFNMTDNRDLGQKQWGNISMSGLDKGTYRLAISSRQDDDDFIIIHLSMNCARLVTRGPLYLAGDSYEGGDFATMWAWCYLDAAGEIRFKTTEAALPQYVTVYGADSRQYMFVNTSDEWYGTGTLQPGVYRIKSGKGDILLEAPQGIFSLSEDALFVPYMNAAAYEDGWLTIDNALRGAHTFWTYVENGSLQLEVTKRDMNWYEGADELSIEVYSFDGELLGNTSIPDGGGEGASGVMGTEQTASLSVGNLSEGAYRIELAGGNDLLITGLRVNQGKLVVADSVYLAGMTPAYFGGEGLEFAAAGLYGQNFGPRQITLFTSHANGKQQVTIVGDDYTSTADVKAVDTYYRIDAYDGPYCLIAPKQDLIIQFNGYLSFTPDSFFYPQRCEIVDLQYSMPWINSNVDYVVMDYGDYMLPLNDQGWLVGRATWEAEDLDIVNNKLTFCINVPHLTQAAYVNSTVAIDWINIKLIAEPFWRR